MTENGRLEKELCWEIGLVQQCKHGQKICGDHIVITQDGDRVRIVLSDGLGSGVQANIASTLTATLVSGMTEKAFLPPGDDRDSPHDKEAKSGLRHFHACLGRGTQSPSRTG